MPEGQDFETVSFNMLFIEDVQERNKEGSMHTSKASVHLITLYTDTTGLQGWVFILRLW